MDVRIDYPGKLHELEYSAILVTRPRLSLTPRLDSAVVEGSRRPRILFLALAIVAACGSAPTVASSPTDNPTVQSPAARSATFTAAPTATPQPTIALTSVSGRITIGGKVFSGPGPLYLTFLNADAFAKPCEFQPGPIDVTVAVDGTFGPRRLSAGRYFVVARTPGYLAHVWTKVGPGSGSNWFYKGGDCEAAETITLQAGQDFTLTWAIP